MMYGDAYAVEHRYAVDIYDALIEDGFTAERY